MWISSALGLPAAGLVLDGLISAAPDVAKVSVFTPMGSVVPIGLVWTLWMVGSASSFIAAPSLSGAALVAFAVASAYGVWRRTRRAVALVAADAVAALQQMEAPLPEQNGVADRAVEE
jgi:hypothetical protein